MSNRRLISMLAATAALLAPALITQAQADFIEDFNTVTGTGGGVFFVGSGFGDTGDLGWDDGITGESAFGAGLLFAHVELSAHGNPSGGVGGSGAGELSASLLSFNMLDEALEQATETGGGVFLEGDGVTPDLSGSTDNWDDGISGEGAFFGAYDGAILVNAVSAYGDADGGVDSSGAGVLVVDNVDVTTGGWYAGLTWQIPGFPAGAAAVLHNGGFDDDGYNPPFGGDFSPSGWTLGGDAMWLQGPPDWMGNVYIEGGQAPPLSGVATLKMWCAWWVGYPNDSYVYQDLPAQEGQTWELDCFTYHMGSEPLAPANRAEMRIEFYDAGDALLDSHVSVVLDASSDTDTWIDNAPLQAAAPAGTAHARAVLAYVAEEEPAGLCGAAFYEDATFEVVSGPPAFDYSQFSLAADIKGVANEPAGEVYGHYQLRIEDSDGDRLVFPSTAPADGVNWVTLGGSLDEAEEQDANGQPATGVFNPASSTFTIVVAFDNDREPTWGTGGTLLADNLLMPNDISGGSDYYAGLFWDDLTLPETEDPRDLMLTADIKGNVIGGNYELRFEGFAAIPPVDEDFEAATGEGGDQLIFPGGNSGDSDDWDTGIEYAYAFAGVVNGVVTEPAGGAWVQGITSGGNPGGAAVIEAHEIALGTDGLWYIGIAWGDQSLASTELSDVTLTADIMSTWNPGLLEQPSRYILRIEDEQGDWIGFDGIADGNWHTVGGALSDFTASGTGESGDGVFDIDADALYTVVVVMESAGTSDWGGTLTMDNVFLTPPADPVEVQRGTITFYGTADGTFQPVGGLLSEGDSTWPVVGGCFWPGDWGIVNWDRGIEGEEAFAGTYNATIGSACIEGDPTCGVGGGGGGRFTWSDVDAEGGYMWLGAAWHGLELQTPLDLSQVEIYADVKGTWEPAEGQSPGIITVRLEEDGVEARRSFDSIADGAYHTVGGPLDTAYIDGADPDPNAPAYAMVIIIHGPRTPTWGTGGTVEFDNVWVIDHGLTVLEENFETVFGPTPGFLNDAGVLDSYTLTVTMEDGVESWGLGSCPGDLDGDRDIDLSDLARLLSNYGMTSGATYEDGDLDGDEDVDLSDLAALLSVYGTSCAGPTLTVDNLAFEVVQP